MATTAESSSSSSKNAVTDQLGVAFVGAGIWASKALLPNVVKNSHCHIKAIYSRTASSATKLAGQCEQLLSSSVTTTPQDGENAREPVSVYSGEELEEMLARTDLDAIILAWPIPLLGGMVLKILESGKSVLSEKPIATSTQEAQSLMQRYKKEFLPQGLVWHVGECFRFEEALHYVHRKMVQEQVLGTILSVQITFIKSMNPSIPYYHTEWRKHGTYAGGWLLDTGVHHIASLRTITGRQVTSVAASGRLIQEEYLKNLDTVNAVLLLDDGSSATYTFSFACDENNKCDENRITIWGQRGRLVVFPDRRTDANGKPYGAWIVQEDYVVSEENTDIKEGNQEDGSTDKGIGCTSSNNKRRHQQEHEFEMTGVGMEIDHFINSVLRSKCGGGLPDTTDIQEAFADLAAIEALLTSMEKKTSGFENVLSYSID